MKHFQPRIQNQQGVALVITLGILAVLLILVIGFAVSMRTEQVAARNFSYVVVARQLAHAAVDEAIFLIRTNTPIIDANNYYVTQPGRIVSTNRTTGLGSADDLIFSVFTPLSSAGTVDINADRSIIAPNTVYDTAAKRAIRVDWVNVCANGQASGAPLIGRYAFWVDDEAAKININSAMRRINILGTTPQDVDLTVISGIGAARASNSWNFARTNGFFTTEHWKLADNIGSALYVTNKFYLTSYSVDTAITPWGAARLNLNDPAQATVLGISNVLDNVNLTNWFGAGQTFTGKYVNVAQIAANIVDWIDANNIPTDSAGAWDDVNPPQYLGLEVSPYMNELLISNVVTVVDDGGTNYNYTYEVHTYVELWNIYQATYSGTNEIYLAGRPLITITNNTAGVLRTIDLSAPFTITHGDDAGLGLPVGPSSFRVVRKSETFTFSTNQLATGVSLSGTTVTGIYRRSPSITTPGWRIDYAVMPLAARTFPVTPPPVGGSATSRTNQISAANDPRVKPVNNNFVAVVTGVQGTVGTLGTFNTSAVFNQNVLTGRIRADGERSSHTNSPPFRDKGRIDSIGELGYIHTGWPWRTLRLLPQTVEEVSQPRLIPDWAVLDLFVATNLPVQGRININSGVTNLVSGQTPRRLTPLESLLTASLGVAAASSTNIYDCTFDPTLFVNSPPPTFLPGVFTFIGQICEVSGFAPATGDDEVRERRIRSLANLITVRSNAFTIWAVGQAIQDVNGNGVFDAGDLIVAEAKAQAVVERVQNPGADGIYGTGDDTVSFRTLYFRYLTE